MELENQFNKNEEVCSQYCEEESNGMAYNLMFEEYFYSMQLNLNKRYHILQVFEL